MSIRVEGLRVRYPGAAEAAVRGVDFEVGAAELFVLLGPSGSGKTTILRALGGFERPEAGRIEVGGKVVCGPEVFLPAEKRGLGFVFQDYALFPHLNVAGNVGFGLPRAERASRVPEVLAEVGLEALADRRPHALSGGQQQRVALARALAPRPPVMLLDEPFGNLDAATRQQLRRQTMDLLRAQGVSAVLVTHDQEEALSLGDRIAVMREGRIEQIGTPDEIYAKPRTAFVAEFLGHTNLIDGEASQRRALTPLGEVTLNEAAEGPVRLSVRPHQLVLGGEGAEGRVLLREFQGHCALLKVQVGELDLWARSAPEHPARRGDSVRVRAREAVVVA